MAGPSGRGIMAGLQGTDQFEPACRCAECWLASEVATVTADPKDLPGREGCERERVSVSHRNGLRGCSKTVRWIGWTLVLGLRPGCGCEGRLKLFVSSVRRAPTRHEQLRVRLGPELSSA